MRGLTRGRSQRNTYVGGGEVPGGSSRPPPSHPSDPALSPFLAVTNAVTHRFADPAVPIATSITPPPKKRLGPTGRWECRGESSLIANCSWNPGRTQQRRLSLGSGPPSGFDSTLRGSKVPPHPHLPAKDTGKGGRWSFSTWTKGSAASRSVASEHRIPSVHTQHPSPLRRITSTPSHPCPIPAAGRAQHHFQRTGAKQVKGQLFQMLSGFQGVTAISFQRPEAPAQRSAATSEAAARERRGSGRRRCERSRRTANSSGSTGCSERCAALTVRMSHCRARGAVRGQR